MADEKDQVQQASQQATPQGASGVSKSAYVTVDAGPRAQVPPAASARLVWTDGERSLDYVATAGHVDVRANDNRLKSQMFALSYVVVDSEGKADRTRPVTFAYNGGPGSASVPINFGGIGPKRVETDGMSHLAPGAACVDNPCTILPDTDLVFLDAPGTGWSVVADGTEPSELFGVDADADAFARAIICWLEQNHRWTSPVYIFGESYGTVRNAVLARVLGEKGVKVTGIVMLSAIWDWVQTLPGEDLYYLGMMPTYAAAAQYFGKAGQGVDEDEWFDRAMDWAEDVYAPALLRGDRLGEEREREVAEELAGFVGLPADYLVLKHLRVDLTEYRLKVLEAERQVCGRLDMRFVSDAPSPAQLDINWVAAEDAADDAVDAVWEHAFRAFVSDELGYQGLPIYMGQNYEAVGTKWSWDHEEPGTGYGKVGAPNVTVDLATALRRNPTCKLCVIGGRYDAATTFWNVRHDLACQFLSAGLKDRVTWLRYGCGHMAYVDVPTLEAMARDLHEFYAKR